MWFFRSQPPVSERTVVDYGADPTGAKDSSAAFNAAAKAFSVVRVPAGSYRIDQAIRLVHPGTVVTGDGRSTTLLFVHSKDLTRFGSPWDQSGVIIANQSGDGPIIRDLSIRFDNDLAPASRRDILHNPPAINWNGVARGTVSHVRISRAYVGILCPGNAGGITLEDVECSSLRAGLYMPGDTFDSVKITRWHQWWFDFGKEHIALASDNEGYALQIHACDDLHVSDSLFFCDEVSVTGGFGAFSNCDFDNSATLSIRPVKDFCVWSFTGCFFSNAGGSAAQQVSIVPSGIDTGNSAEVNFVGCSFGTTDLKALGSPLIEVRGVRARDDQLSVNFAGCNFRWFDNGAQWPLIRFSNAFFSLSASRFFPMDRGRQAYSVIEALDGCRGALAGVLAYDWGVPSRLFIASDTESIIAKAGNVLPGYAV